MLKKRSFLLAAFLSLAFLALISAKAETSGFCGPQATWAYDGKTITIRGSGPIWDQPRYEEPHIPREICREAQALVIEPGITVIGDEAFRDAYALAHAEIPYTVTRIGAEAFADAGLHEIVLPEGVTTIGANAFESCDHLVRAVFPASLQSIGSFAFYACNGLTEITLPGSVQIGRLAFSSCKSLSSVALCKNAYLKGNAFFDCENLTSFTAEGTLDAEINPFYGCKALFDENGLIIIGNTLYSYDVSRPETDVIVPEGVERIVARAFSPSESEPSPALTRITLPDTLRSIGDYAFAGCENLRDITLPDTITEIGFSAFWNCSLLFENTGGFLICQNALYGYTGQETTVRVPQGITEIADGAFQSGRCQTVILPEGVTRIGKKAFADCDQLSSILLPTTLKTIDAWAFKHCDRLSSYACRSTAGQSEHFFMENGILFRYYLPSSVTNLTPQSLAESGLCAMIVPDLDIIDDQIEAERFAGNSLFCLRFNGSTIQSRAFADCKNLRVVIVGSQHAAIADDAFEGCSPDLLFIRMPVTAPDEIDKIEQYAMDHGFQYQEGFSEYP